MITNEQIVRAVYAAAEARSLNADKFVSLFASDGYFLDMASGQRWTGEEVRQPIAGLASIFPNMHRELVKIYSTADDVVVVELRLQGTQAADFPIPGGVIPSNGKAFDVPCCDVFHLEGGKVVSFHCYNMQSIWLAQLTAAAG